MRQTATPLVGSTAALLATATGSVSARAADRPLVVPFARPWLARVVRNASGAKGGRDGGAGTAYAGLMPADGLVQAAGVVQIALAFVHGELRCAKDSARRERRNSEEEREMVGKKKNAPRSAEQQASNEAAKKPTRDDVHEQRQHEQSQEGVVKQGARPPAQSQIDAERGDWEGMGQSQHRP
jgi:hypothetical protein